MRYKKKFSVTFVLEVEEPSDVVSTVEDAHVEDMDDLIHNEVHNIDDVNIENLNIWERI